MNIETKLEVKSDINIEQDLTKEQNHSISQLLEEKNEKNATTS